MGFRVWGLGFRGLGFKAGSFDEKGGICKVVRAGIHLRALEVAERDL